MKHIPYRNYLLTVLLTILAFNYADRSALGLVLQSIKTDLNLSDTQLGFLTGIAFALFYSIMGIPIARWSDRGNRVAIISVTTALWSVAVSFTGMAGSFVQLLLIRVGVAIGEAGCMPPAHSLIPDYFNRAERPRAVAIYMLGGSLSVLIGFFVAGWLNEFYGWRAMFALLGLPGIALGGLAWFSLEEPRRRPSALGVGRSARVSVCQPKAASAMQPTLKQVCATLSVNATFRNLLFCFAVTSFFGFGIGQWQAAFFIRSYGLETGELGTWFAVIYGLGGILGTYCGGTWASRFAPRNERVQLRAVAIVCSSFSVIYSLIYISPNQYVAFAILAVASVGGATITGPLFATIQTLVPQRMRSTSIAIIYLFANLIGMGLGPLAAGALSDGLRRYVGAESLRFALLALCPGYLWGGWHLWRASRTVVRDLEKLQVEDSERLSTDFETAAAETPAVQ